MTTVNIVTSDRGWILERLAREIAGRLPYVTFGEGPDPRAAIQYYVTFSSRHRRLSPVEVGYFAHLEPEGDAREKFFAVAREVEHCVCHARLYEGVLREAGVEHVTTISPGVDLEHFRPKLRIGVVGRTYHTGRKGEALVAAVMDVPEIEWSFTGEGWPGPALDLPAEALPDYYRGLDYVLVPALYEGGPMCVVEALAVGTEVIAPPIGWVPEFPHVEYRVGDAADLRRVLLELVEKKRRLRASVLDRTWDAWAEGHDRVFQGLAKAHGIALAPAAARPPRPPRARAVGLVLHGNEGRSQGGPTVRVPRLARELRENGVEAELRIHPSAKGFGDLDLVHVFNTWSPPSALDALRRARAAGRAVVFSPILLDLAQRGVWEEQALRLFAGTAPGAAAEAALDAFRARLAEARAGTRPAPEPVPGFHAAVREMAELSDRLIFLSERERTRLAALGARVSHGSVVRNPVDARLYAEADPALFERETGLRDFVLCVARVEPRKNQLMLAMALAGTGVPLVLVGHTASPAYREILERHRTPDLHLLDRLPPNSPLLASAFAAARVAVLPSWAEGAPLAALEAAASGSALVLSDESGESEYFGDLARYVDPGDPAAIRDAVLAAYETRRSAEEVAHQKAFIAESYSWDRHREATEAAYAEAVAAARGRAPALVPAAVAPAARTAPVRVVFDLTTTANHTGRWTGIARVEAALALALRATPGAEVAFVAWNNKARDFVEVPFEALRAGRLAPMVAHYDTNPPPPLSLPAGAHMVVPGSAWMQNQVYAEGVVALARRFGLRLTPIIHDIIPTKFPFWFNDGYAPVFEQNLAMLLDGADHVVAISQATRRDVEAHAARTQGLFIPEVSVFREGDEIRQMAEAEDAEGVERVAQHVARRPFVLTVGAIHQRKNHKLLYDVWLKLAERMGGRCPHLVIVGGVAWNGHDVARALRGDPRLRDHVTILDNVGDRTLDWLYRNCLFTVYPSLYEGWGLPVGESLRYGKLCLAADTSSVPEIAPGLVELTDPLDVAAWAMRVQFYAGSRSAREAAEARIAARHRPVTWAESAAQLLGLLAAAEARPRPPRPYTLGTVVSLSDRVAASRIRGAGWHPLERWGCWARGLRAELVFEPGLRPGEKLVLAVEGRALSFPNTPFEVRVLANGHAVSHWRIRGGEMQVMHAVIPAAIAAAPRLRIEFEAAFLTPVRQVTRSDDPRVVGLGVAKVALALASALPDAARAFGEPPRLAQRLELGRRYDLLADRAGHAFLAGRWTATSAWGLASTEQRPRLEMVVQDLPGRDLEMEIALRPMASPAAPLLLVALVNGEEAAAWTFADDAPVSVTLPLTAAARARGEPVMVDLLAADARAPQALGLGAGTEAIGFGLLALEARPTGAPGRVPRLPLAEGTPLLLTSAQPAEAVAALRAALGHRWHAPETGGAWSFGRAARLPLRLDPDAPGARMLRLRLEPYRPDPAAGAAVVEVALGERVLARRALAGVQELDVPLPPGCWGAGGELDLDLRVDAARSPFAAGRGPDERPLGLRLSRVEVAAVPLLRAGRVLAFRTDPLTGPPHENAAASLRGGWFAPDEAGVWSRADGGALAIAPDPGLGAGWRLFVLARAIGGRPGQPAVVEVELDGAALDRWEFTGDAPAVAELRGIAARMAAGGTPGMLGFRRLDPVTPREAGAGEDDRPLGVMLAAALILGGEPAVGEARARFAAAGFGIHAALEGAGAGPAQPDAGEAGGEDAAEAPSPQDGDDAPAGPAAAAEPEPDAHPAGSGESAEPVPAQSSMFDLSAGGTLGEATLEGWYAPEPEGRWSRAEGAVIRLPRPAETGDRLRIEIFGRVFGTAATGPAEVALRLHGGEAATIRYESDEFVQRVVELDCSALPPDATGIALMFHRAAAVSPAEAGEGADDRRLGLLLRTLSLVWR